MECIEEVISDISKRAKKYKVNIAVGLALKNEDSLLNSGLIFNRDGELAGSCGKSNLWHFDRKWFSCGTNFGVIETDIGKVGLIVCADGRAPEISRILALKGAEIIIDMANLTATGNDASKLTNPQVEYMLPTRALENGVWLVMADKVGIEADSVLYAGRSCIISPDGEVIASASSDKSEVIYSEITIDQNRRKLPERRPEEYKLLTQLTENLPIYSSMAAPVVIWDTELQAGAIQFEYKTAAEYIEKAKRFIKVLEDQDTVLIALPQLRRDIDFEICVEELRSSICCFNTIIAVTGYRQESGSEFKSTIVASSDRVYGIYDKIHVNEQGLAGGTSGKAVIKTPLCTIGIMHDQEGMIPEAARCLMLGGADVILWSDNEGDNLVDLIARTRASENKVYIVRTGSMGEKDYSMIVSPDGRIISCTMSGVDQSTATLLVTAMCNSKTVVPGTNVVLDRKPFLYEVLVR
jgi:predicted amidohydrolase